MTLRVESVVGHPKITETYDTYGHLLDPDTDDLGAAFEQHFDGPMGDAPECS
jgi:hypothetical protein